MTNVTRAMAWLGCCAAVGGLVSAPAGAETPVPPVTVALDYAAPSACPDATAFEAIVSGRLGYEPFRAQGPERVIVTIASGARGTEGRMEWRDAGGKWAGERTFPARGDDCGELARAMGFALALQIQFYATSAAADAPAAAASVARATTAASVVASATPPGPPVGTVEKPAQPEAPASSSSSSSTARVRPALAFGGGAAVGFGSSADAVPFARLFGALAWSRAVVELGMELGWPATVRRADSAGFSQQVLLGSLAGCGTGRRFSVCALAKVGQVRIRGKGLDEPASPSGLLLETGARLGLKQALGKQLYVAGYVEGLALLTRWRVSLDGYQVWASPRFVETVGLDMGVLLP